MIKKTTIVQHIHQHQPVTTITTIIKMLLPLDNNDIEINKHSNTEKIITSKDNINKSNKRENIAFNTK